MHLTYVVLLKPSEIRFTQNVLASKFDNGIPLLETFTQLKNGEILPEDIPLIEVVFYSEQWEWYTRNNRRLWVFRELEKIKKCGYIKTKRIEYEENRYPSLLYGSATLAETSRSFTWRENILQITTHRMPSKDIEVLYDEDKRRDRSRTGADYCRKMKVCYWRRRRYHPYLRDEPCDKTLAQRRNPRSTWRHGGQNVEIISWRRRSLESAEKLSLYGHQFNCSVWYKKRQSFLQRVYCVRTGRVKDPARLLEILYTCGVCFKSFRSKVSLNQHSEELLHWACVRCGRFFGSHTALGQHKLALEHTV